MAQGPELNLRVSNLPTLFGAKVVIRILSPDSSGLSIHHLGYEDEEKFRLLNAIRQPHGMVLVTGPTGSGKTQSLYACLNVLNAPEVNIATVEDPCEIRLPGVNQVNVHSAWFFALLAALTLMLWRSGWHREPARLLWLSQQQLRLPVIGAMVQSAVVARWAHTLSALLSAGVPIVEAMGPVASACDHAVYAQASETMRAQVAQGSSLNESMTLSGLFPSMVVQMCAIGEETGSVDTMLARAGALLENEVHDQLAGLSSLLEPVIMVLLGGVVGTILVALYLPIFKLGQVF